LFHYDYTISNNTTTDFFRVRSLTLPNRNLTLNLVTPGFFSNLDAGLGLLDFGGETAGLYAVGRSTVLHLTVHYSQVRRALCNCLDANEIL